MSGETKGAGAAAIASGIQTGPFKYRVAGYIMFYIPLAFVYIMFLYTSEVHFLKLNKPSLITELALLFVVMLPPALPFIFWERSIRKFRRNNNLSVYGDIREVLEQREIDERVRKEHRAFVNNGIAKESGATIDKSDIGYWFGLFERGAISGDEYEAKKRELM
ncbi:MAG: hypothetical protein PHO62_07790 [Sulfurimonas sp.]|uniref:hypothetical protein n=1 Tax=Sulfurimonas sp. TaxID=2022749 RepID=UPI0026105A08|nr:hypothetical protein [Sulfurimonas sp.]MDD5373308.1 hypothetical protein [Sulfurimonas sp.]